MIPKKSRPLSHFVSDLPWWLRLQAALAVVFSCSTVVIDILILDLLMIYTSENYSCINCLFLNETNLYFSEIAFVVAIPIVHLVIRSASIFLVSYVSYNVGFFYSTKILRDFSIAGPGGLSAQQIESIRGIVESRSILFSQRFVGGGLSIIWASLTFAGLCYLLFGFLPDNDVGQIKLILGVGVFYFGVSLLCRRGAWLLSRKVPAALHKLNKGVNEFVDGFIEFKFFGGQEVSLGYIEQSLAVVKKNLSCLDILGVLPKYILETVLVGIVLIAISGIGEGDLAFDLEFGTLGAFGYLLVRMMPLVQVINQGLVNVSGSSSLFQDNESLRELAYEAYLAQRNSANLNFLADRRKLRLVLGTETCDVGLGDIVRISGPSGSGKSTILKGLAGLVDLEQFRVFDNDQGEVSVYNDTKWASDVAYMSQEPSLVFERVGEYFTSDQAEHAFELAQILDATHLFLENRIVGELSGGERKMVAIVRNLVKPSLIKIFDEPCAGLDADAIVRLKALWADARSHSLIFYTSHNKNFIFENAFEINAQQWRSCCEASKS